jgi:hypothetical protein
VFGDPVSLNDPVGLMGAGGGGSATHPSQTPIVFANVESACVLNYLSEHYGDFLGFLTDVGNLQQFLPSLNGDSRPARYEAGFVIAEKAAITKGPGLIGRQILKQSASYTSARIGSGLISLGGLASGTIEVAGAFVTPFSTFAMDQAISHCSCH